MRWLSSEPRRWLSSEPRRFQFNEFAEYTGRKHPAKIGATWHSRYRAVPSMLSVCRVLRFLHSAKGLLSTKRGKLTFAGSCPTESPLSSAPMKRTRQTPRRVDFAHCKSPIPVVPRAFASPKDQLITPAFELAFSFFCPSHHCYVYTFQDTRRRHRRGADGV